MTCRKPYKTRIPLSFDLEREMDMFCRAVAAYFAEADERGELDGVSVQILHRPGGNITIRPRRAA